ncbi:MAG: CYTH domain-containing protein [Victivallales bacterium]|nr:CYTH domain-containing protein [Victivallales bacterium]MCF7888663.1 CYTH domain-containing protein [Victivallales bacterium]
MGLEIERKFLVKNLNFLKGVTGVKYSQGYIPSDGNPGLRIRIAGDKGFITLKSNLKGIKVRREFEYEIPVKDAEEMLQFFCLKPYIEKYRYKLDINGRTWEIDVFEGDNKGLVLAEVELDDENQQVEKPEWIEKEVTGDCRYQNSSLAVNPYCSWKDK